MARNRGAQLYHLAMIWRVYRGRRGTRGEGMISKISGLIDMWIAKDKGERQ
jgi:hypothetical protein